MNIDDLTIGQARAISDLFGAKYSATLENKLVGEYVVVRCRDAGVHAGFLESHLGRECVLTESRRLWKWVPKSGKWLSAVANNGLSGESKITEPVPRIHLTEACEIIGTTSVARKLIQGLKNLPFAIICCIL